MENTAEFYYEKLKDTTNPGAVLSSFYCSLYDITPTRSEIIMMNRLMKIFGRFTLFFSILSMAGSYPDRIDSPYGLLYKICNNKFEQNHGLSLLQSHESLDKYINSIGKDLDSMKKKKLKIPSSEGLKY